jgi:hypothetical protein
MFLVNLQLDGIITIFGGSGQSLIYAFECANATCKDGNIFPFVMIVASKANEIVRVYTFQSRVYHENYTQLNM